MAVHWQIKFKSLRAGTDYTVSIYDETYTGNPVQLMGAADPFTTEEDSDEDMFTPICTQSGYLRIVDDGTFNWKDIVPVTDTARPVVLSSESEQRTNILWQGFLQAQNFSGTLYGGVQVRDFPIQCPLTVTQGTDINYEQTEIQNFAYLLKTIIDSIPQICRPTNFVIQGGAKAQQWLLKKIDWQNFCAEDNDGNLSARYSMFQCLEDMCSFWGWTARTYGNTIYMACADDAAMTTWLVMTSAQLATMAGGTAAGNTADTFETTEILPSDDVFVSMNNDEYVQRGPNKAEVSAETGTADEDVIEIYPPSVIKEMNEGGSYSTGGSGFGNFQSGSTYYTNDKLSFETETQSGTARTDYASFNVATYVDAKGRDSHCVVRIKKSFSSTSATAYAALQTIRPHAFTDGIFTVEAEFWKNNEKYSDASEIGIGKKNMYVRFGVGMTRQTAKWYTGGIFNDSAWSDNETAVKIPVGGTDKVLFSVNTRVRTNTPILIGRVFFELLGSDDIPEENGQRIFDVADITVSFKRNSNAFEVNQHPSGNFMKLVDREMSNSHTYTSENNNNVRNTWDANLIYASENNSVFGYGVLLNIDGSYLIGADFGGTDPERPEQHLANRVTSYWASSKRGASTEMRSDSQKVSGITPRHKVTLDGTTFYPISISHNWRDDVTALNLIEL